MRVAKSSYAGVVTRPFEFKGQFYLGIANTLFVPTGTQPRLIAESAMWPFFQEKAGADAAIDAALPKVQPEFLVLGACYPPRPPAAACPVRVKLAGQEKVLAVFGNRAWLDDRITQPQPFEYMPLTWAQSFGGGGYPANPLGRGDAPADEGGQQIHRLPNIEYPGQLIATPKQKVPPAGYAPVDQMWPQRAKLAGTYDDEWLKTQFPAFARDIDWHFFNIAPADQWLGAPLRGDEDYELENLHPGQRVLSGRLPALCTRTIVNRMVEGKEKLEEISMRLTTVWFFPDAERIILVFHGMAKVAEEDAADVLQMLVGVDSVGAGKPAEHYAHVLAERLDKKRGAIAALREQDLLPPGVPLDDCGLAAMTAALTASGKLSRNLNRRHAQEIEASRATVAGLGLDPDKHAPQLPATAPAPSLEEMPDFAERMIAEGEKDQAQFKAALAANEKELEGLFASLGMNFATVRAERARSPVGPPSLSAQQELDDLKRLRDGFVAEDKAHQELDKYLKDPQFRELFVNAEARGKEAYRQTAHYQDAAPRMEAERAQAVRRQVLERYGQGSGLAGVDLTGADLSALDLHGADFSGALLESVDFEGSNLSGCNFAKAVLARANLANAKLAAANCAEANLAEIRCRDTVFDRANLRQAILRKADLTRASFRGAEMEKADCGEARFEQTDWSGAKAPRMVFLDTDLGKLVATGAELRESIFLRCVLDEIDFSGAVMDGSAFVGTRGQRAVLRDASLRKCSFTEACDFRASDFSGADLATANFRQAMLQEARFDRARAVGADFSEADMRTARFYSADMREARFVKTDLRGAILASANLMDANLQRSNLCGVDGRYANLFQADLARARVDQGTRFDGSLSRRVRTYPRAAATPAPQSDVGGGR